MNMPIPPFMNNLANYSQQDGQAGTYDFPPPPPRPPISYLPTKLIFRLSIDGHLPLHAVCRNPP